MRMMAIAAWKINTITGIISLIKSGNTNDRFSRLLRIQVNKVRCRINNNSPAIAIDCSRKDSTMTVIPQALYLWPRYSRQQSLSLIII